MKLLWWSLAALLLIVVGSFTGSNLGDVALRLWPLPGELGVPTFLVVLLALLIGICVGSAAASLSGRRRRRLRELQDRNAELARQLDGLRRSHAVPSSGQVIEGERRQRMSA